MMAHTGNHEKPVADNITTFEFSTLSMAIDIPAIKITLPSVIQTRQGHLSRLQFASLFISFIASILKE